MNPPGHQLWAVVSWASMALLACQFASVAADDDDPPEQIAGTECADAWKNQLLSLDFNIKKSPHIQFSASADQDLLKTIKTVKDGYLLVRPAGSVESPKSGAKNGISIWAYFICNKDKKLVHDHCRLGDADNPAALKLPVTKTFDQTGDKLVPEGTKDKSDDKIYVCRPIIVGDDSFPLKGGWNGPEAVPKAAQMWLKPAPAKGEYPCKRIGDSKWCGYPADVETSGCLDEWNILQNKVQLDDNKPGVFLLPSAKPDPALKETLRVTVACETGKLAVKECNKEAIGMFTGGAMAIAKLPPGFYQKTKGTMFGCPPNADTAEAIKAKVVIVKAAAGVIPKEVDGLKPNLPAGIEKKCEVDFDKLTKAGVLSLDADGFVKIVDELTAVDASGNGGARSIWAKFKCAVKLTLETCRVGDKKDGKPLASGSFTKEKNGQFSNCGKDVESKDVEAKVTRSKDKAVAGLTEQK